GSVAAAPPSWRRFFTFMGPAMLVSVGYMDPGNWATDLEGGSRFGYTLLWVLVASNVIAIVLQHLASRLGIVTGSDLAQCCRRFYPQPVVLALWALCQGAIVACDLAEVIGSAVALNLLFHIPLLWGAVITVLDVLLILLLQHGGIRRLEAIVIVLIGTIAACLGAEVWLAQPEWPLVAAGLKPTLNGAQLYVAVAMLGATVMPHNLYLHSSLVKTRRIEGGPAGQRQALRTSLFNTALALSLALLVNAAILIVAADVFHPQAIAVEDLREAHRLLAPLLGVSAASVLFAIALLAAGQSATITGTMAGQAVMLGFLKLETGAVTVRIATRLAAIVPAVLMIGLFGPDSTVALLVGTQIALSMQLPFAIVPLVRITSSPTAMGALKNSRLLHYTGTLIAVMITAMNLWLVWHSLHESAWWTAIATLAIAGLALLGYVAVHPIRDRDPRSAGPEASERHDHVTV
ncbi:MAG: Nramp family divalent metal transporter, partial [Pseudomonadota bacterium]|nr:Nramp family divalent metal transporter [Pseudomonadota bacterium]